MKKRVLTILICLNLALIWGNSLMTGADSGALSGGVLAFVGRFFPVLLTEAGHTLLRKAAHFSEFALLGFLTAGLLLWVSHRFLPMKPLATWLIPAAFTLLYAASDEIHQIFTNRGPRVTDVLIDFAGALFGILLIHCAVWLVSACRRGKHTPKKSRAGRRKTRA